MATKRNAIMVVGLLAASFAGGIVGQRLFPIQPAFGQAGQAQVQQTVTAEKFVLVDGDGGTRAELRYEKTEGLDGMASLVLYDDDGSAMQLATSTGSRSISLYDADGNDLVNLHSYYVSEADTLIGLVMTSPHQQAPEWLKDHPVSTLSLGAGSLGGSLRLRSNDGDSIVDLDARDGAPTIKLDDSDERDSNEVVWQAP